MTGEARAESCARALGAGLTKPAFSEKRGRNRAGTREKWGPCGHVRNSALRTPEGASCTVETRSVKKNCLGTEG